MLGIRLPSDRRRILHATARALACQRAANILSDCGIGINRTGTQVPHALGILEAAKGT